MSQDRQQEGAKQLPVAMTCPHHEAFEGRLERIEIQLDNTYKLCLKLNEADGPIGTLNVRMAAVEDSSSSAHHRLDTVDQRLAGVTKASGLGAIGGGASSIVVVLILVMKLLGMI